MAWASELFRQLHNIRLLIFHVVLVPQLRAHIDSTCKQELAVDKSSAMNDDVIVLATAGKNTVWPKNRTNKAKR